MKALAPPSLDITEKQFTSQLVDLAKTFGWLRHHSFLAIHSPSGFPDEVLVRGDRLIFAELKSEKGKLTDRQEVWLEALRQVPGIEVFVWRPSDFERIVECLR